MIYSDSGVAELGCIFTTPNTTAASRQSPPAPPEAETTWITVDYDPAALRIAYVWMNPGRVATELRIQLEPTSDGGARSHIHFRYTGLSPEGNREVERYDRKWFEQKMHGWESAINHYLRTGRKIDSTPWE